MHTDALMLVMVMVSAKVIGIVHIMVMVMLGGVVMDVVVPMYIFMTLVRRL